MRCVQWFAAAFLAHWVGLIAVAGVYGPQFVSLVNQTISNMPPPQSGPGGGYPPGYNQTGDGDHQLQSSSQQAEFKAVIGILCVSAIIGAVGAGLFLWLMKKVPGRVVKLSLILNLLVDGVALAICFALGATPVAIVLLVYFVILCIWSFAVRNRIPFAEAVLTAASHVTTKRIHTHKQEQPVHFCCATVAHRASDLCLRDVCSAAPVAARQSGSHPRVVPNVLHHPALVRLLGVHGQRNTPHALVDSTTSYCPSWLDSHHSRLLVLFARRRLTSVAHQFTSTYAVAYSVHMVPVQTNPGTPSPEYTMESEPFTAAEKLAIAFLIFSLYWTSQVFRNVSHVTTAGTVASWWLVSDIERPTLGAFKRAMTSSFGTICAGSLVVAIVDTLIYLLSRMSDVGAAVMRCLLQLFNGILKWLNKYALVEVAMYGFSVSVQHTKAPHTRISVVLICVLTRCSRSSALLSSSSTPPARCAR